MNSLMLLFGAATMAAQAPDNSTAPKSLSQASERDLQCLTLAFVAAGIEKDPKKLQSAIAEGWYFLGRLDAAAPGIDLGPEANRALEAMNGDPHTKDIGVACDALFTSRGKDLVNMGKEPQGSNP